MRMSSVVHVLAGALGLLAGYAALFSPKGGRLHRFAGKAFVVAMVGTALLAVALAIGKGVEPAVNVPSAILVLALVMTSAATLRPSSAGVRAVELGGFFMALGVGVASTGFGVEAIARGGTRNGMPAIAFLMFGIAGLVAAAGDFEILRRSRPTGSARIARHLWRMTWALFVAAMSLFIGQAKVFPAPLRVPGLLALPVLVVLVLLAYWMWKVRWRRSLGRAEARVAE